MKHVRQVLKVGGSVGVTLPAQLANSCNLKHGDIVVFRRMPDGGLRIDKLEDKSRGKTEEKSGH
jgi:antitoxin component of MazEF toxin-antitoxin module